MLVVSRNLARAVPEGYYNRLLMMRRAEQGRIRERGAIGGHTVPVTVRAERA